MNIAELSIKRPVFIVMIVASILTLGVVGFTNLPVDLLPNVESPNIMVATAYPGASVEEIESRITKPLENALGTVEGLDTLSSISREGGSFVNVLFKLGVNIQYAELKVREKVQAAMVLLPADVNQPVIRRFSSDDFPIMFVSILGKRDLTDLRDILENEIQPKVEAQEGVGATTIIGARKRLVEIDINQSLLSAHGISYNQLVAAISKKNVSFPVGSVSGDGRYITIRITTKAGSLPDLENLSFTTSTGKILRIKDVASVRMGLEDEVTRARVNGQNAVLFLVFKQSGSNTVAVAKNVRAALDSLVSTLPQGVSTKIVSDSSVYIDRSIKGVQQDILTGAILAVLIVWLFLGNIRSTLITATVLPNAIMGAFFLVFLFGFSLNTMTLLALSLCVGLLIDDSIVVRENIFRYMEHGMDPKAAALKGTTEVGLAVLSTTLSILSVFIPISFLQGYVGQFFREFGLTVVCALCISLLDAFTTAPMLSAYWYKHPSKEEPKGFFKYTTMLNKSWNKVYDFINRSYQRLLSWSLRHKPHVIISMLLLFLGSCVSSGFIGKSFMSTGDSGSFSVRFELYPSATIDETDRYSAAIEEFLSKQPGIDVYYSQIGDNGYNLGTINVSMKALSERKVSTQKVMGAVRGFMKGRFDKPLRFSVSDRGGGASLPGMGYGSPIQINIYGTDLAILQKVGQDMLNVVNTVRGATDAALSVNPGNPELVVTLDEMKSEKLGFAAADLGLLVRSLIQGSTISAYDYGDTSYDVVLRLRESDRKRVSDIENMYITTKTGVKVPLASIAHFSYSAGPREIRREGNSRIVRITANLEPGSSLSDVVSKIQTSIDAKVVKPAGYTYQFTGQQKSFSDLVSQIMFAIVLALLFMYMILASLYNSFVQPLILMLSIPLALIGSFLALLIVGIDLDIFGYIGILLVLGLVAKNAILLIDFTNKYRKEGKSIREALLTASPIRLRPILMTSFALIFGMLPLALGLNEGSTGRQALPVTVIGGLLTSTFLTLLIVPVVYEAVEGFFERRRQRKAENKGHIE
jgi:hydrophobic/amphiphilic exporter-1 (mainly G- bacteria), HAE1 family